MAKNTNLEKFLISLPIQLLETFFVGMDEYGLYETGKNYRLYRMGDGSILEVDLKEDRFSYAFTIDEDAGEYSGTVTLEELLGYE